MLIILQQMQETVEIMRGKPNGAYLVRFSAKHKGHLTISYMANNQCLHTQIEPRDGIYICNNKQYRSVEDIIDDNKHIFISPVEVRSNDRKCYGY